MTCMYIIYGSYNEHSIVVFTGVASDEFDDTISLLRAQTLILT